MDKVIHQADYMKQLNQVENMSVCSCDWDDFESKEASAPVQADLLVGSDVIYSKSKVPALIATIEALVSSGGTVAIATRDGRMGVAEFVELMQKHPGFLVLDSIACDDGNSQEQNSGDGGADCSSFLRHDGSFTHTVYTYRRK